MHSGVVFERVAARVALRPLVIVAAPVAAAIGAGIATRVGALPVTFAALLLFVVLLLGARSPALVLGLLAAVIPFEDALVIDGAGSATATKLIGLVFAAGYLANQRRLPRLSVMPVAGWGFLVWAVASGIWTVGFTDWSGTILTLVQMFALGLLVGDLISRNPSIAPKIMWVYSGSAIATIVLYVVAPSITGSLADTGRIEAFASQGPAQFSAVLVPAFLFLVYSGAEAIFRPGLGRLASLFILSAAALIAWASLVSGTRSALVGLIVGLLALVVFGIRRSGGRVALATVGLAGGGAALAIPGASEAILSRVATAISTGGAGREDIWAVGATIFAQHPIIGVGYGAFGAAFTADVIRISTVPGLSLAALYEGRGAHSVLLATAAELGVVGVFLLGTFLWRVLTAESSTALWSYARAAVLAVFAQAMLLDVIERKQVWLVLGIAAGLAVSRPPSSTVNGRHLVPFADTVATEEAGD